MAGELWVFSWRLDRLTHHEGRTYGGGLPCAVDDSLGQGIVFVDATGRGLDTPDLLPRDLVGQGPVLGWTAADRVAVLLPEPRRADPDHYWVTDVPLDGGEPRRLSALPTGGGDYGAGRFHLATGLLADAAVREAGDVDRGPWPLWLRLLTAMAGGAAAAAATAVLRRRLTSRSTTG